MNDSDRNFGAESEIGNCEGYFSTRYNQKVKVKYI